VTIGATTALQTGFFTVIAILCGRCGTTALAAHQVANQCTLLPLMLAFGMSQAAATLTAEAAGENKAHEARRASWDAVTSVAVVMIAMAAGLLLLGRPVLQLMVAAGAPSRNEVLVVAWQLLLVGAGCMLADGVQNVAWGPCGGLVRVI
jgi:MATE family multidrug resistance protein